MKQASIFLPAAAVTRVDGELEVWLVQGGDARQLPFAAAVTALSGDWRLVLPVEAVTACAARLPTQKARWLRQALPFAVEELLAEDVDSLHLALGGELPDGLHRIFAVRRSWLSAWVDLAAELGSVPASLQVDADLLPEEGTQLFWLDGRWLLGGEQSARLGLQDEDWPHLREACALPLHGRAPRERQVLKGIDQWQEQAQPYQWLASHLGSELAQAEFQVRQEHRHQRFLRPVLALAGLWVVLQWGFYLAQGWHLRHEGDNYAAANEALYRELFPQDSKLINLRAQFDQHLASGAATGQGRLLGLLDQAADALLAEGAQVRVQQLDFSDTRGDLSMQVQAPGFDALERLRERLIAAGLAVQLGSASREGTAVSARLVIGG